MKYLIKVPKLNKNEAIEILNELDEVVGVIKLNKKIIITKTETNETFKVDSNPLKLKNRFVLYKNDQVEARIHVGQKIIHSIIEHDTYNFVKSALLKRFYKVYLNREVVANLDRVKKGKQRYYEIDSKQDDFVMVISLFLLARAIRLRALL